MFSSFVIIFREATEAALVLGIVLAYLSKVNKTQLNKYVYGGLGASILAIGITAYVFEVFAGGFTGANEEIFEGIIMLIAATLITPMIFWIKKSGTSLTEEVEEQINKTALTNQGLGIAAFTFLSVYREGVEVVLIFKAIAEQVHFVNSLVGGVLGLTTAIAIAYIIFKTTIKLNLNSVYRMIGGLVILIAAGLLSHGIHELQCAQVIPVLIPEVYNVGGILSEEGTIGTTLSMMFGYNSNPSLLEALAYWLYIMFMVPKYISVGSRRK